jgi:L-cysteine desulfidase
MKKEVIIDILKNEVVPALGCTEPVAVALCAAKAYSVVKGDIENIVLKVSPNIYKNGMSVGIPKINKVGLNVAAAIGVAGGNPDLKLEVLSNLEDKDIEFCEELLFKGKVKVDIEYEMGNFYISCEVCTTKGTGKCVIINSHSNIVYVEANNEVIFKKNERAVNSKTDSEKLKELKLLDIIEEIKKMTFNDLKFMLDGAKMNMKIAEIGLSEKCGMEIGRSIKSCIDNGVYSDDMYHNVVMMTAAGSDARMSGYSLPVMIPVVVVAKRLKASEVLICKALAISHITTIYIKQYTGRLSAMCGCGVAASTGAGVGICYLLNGGNKEMEYTIRNMVGDVSGIICDGAKAGCALKLSTAAGAALKAALLALNGCVIPADNGIVGATVEDTIKNLGCVSKDGMSITDKVVLDIMVEKNISQLC